MSIQQLLLGGGASGAFSYDPIWSNVVLALHGDDTDGSTIFTEESSGLVPQSGHLGGVAISTTESKFGGSSIKFPNNGGLIYANVYNPLFDFGTGDYCFRAWVWWDGDTSNFRVIYDTRDSAGSAVGFILYLDESGLLLLYSGIGFQYISPTSFPVSQWVHIVVNRHAGVVGLYQNGVVLAAVGSGFNYDDGLLSVGDINYSYSNPSVPWSGYMDDIEIIKGQAVYTGAFTPPTAPFPNF